MATVSAIFKKEFRSYFYSPIAYVIITVYLVISNFMFFQGFFLMNKAQMQSYFGLTPWIFLFQVPPITIRIWAEEKKANTLELLLTWPVKDAEVVAGKFLSAFCFLAIVIALSITIPVSIAIMGNPDMGPVIGGYIGSFLLGAAYIAIGMWVSSLTENQIVAFIGGVVITFVLFIVGNQFITMRLPSFVVPVLNYIGLGSHFESISRGVIDTRDIIYYLSVIGFFLYLNVASLQRRMWE